MTNYDYLKYESKTKLSKLSKKELKEEKKHLILLERENISKDMMTKKENHLSIFKINAP